MDEPDNRVVRPPRNRTIGIIGKPKLSRTEHDALAYIGRCIARRGQRLATVPAPGTAAAVREGVESEGGEVVALAENVVDASDHTFIYPDTTLLTRLLTAYPDLHDRSDITVIHTKDLSTWVLAAKEVLIEVGLTPP